MFVIIGFVVVFGSIYFGYTMHGGKISALMQISEFIIIGGAGLGSVIIGFSFKGTIGFLTSGLKLMKGNPYSKKVFLELLQAMYELFVVARKDGLIALEAHVEDPKSSDVISKYKSLVSNHHAMDLLADTLKLVVMGGVNIYDLSDLMEIDIEAQHEEHMQDSKVLQNVGDSMPGFGIVAAVLGVVITMQAIGGPPEEIGYKVAAALVGTFLGILLAYGVFNPMSKAMEAIAACEVQYLNCIKNGIIAFARGDAPLICVEFARRNIEPGLRPGFSETENVVKGKSGDSSVAEAA